MQRPAAAISVLLCVALSAGAAVVAMSAPDPAAPAGLPEALRVAADRSSAAISPLRLLIAVLPIAALVTRLLARRDLWR